MIYEIGCELSKYIQFKGRKWVVDPFVFFRCSYAYCLHYSLNIEHATDYRQKYQIKIDERVIFSGMIKSKLNSFFSQFGCIHNLNELINAVQMFHLSNFNKIFYMHREIAIYFTFSVFFFVWHSPENTDWNTRRGNIIR